MADMTQTEDRPFGEALDDDIAEEKVVAEGRAYLVFEAPETTTVTAANQDEAIRQHARDTDSDGVEFAAVPTRNYKVRAPRKKVIPTWDFDD